MLLDAVGALDEHLVPVGMPEARLEEAEGLYLGIIDATIKSQAKGVNYNRTHRIVNQLEEIYNQKNEPEKIKELQRKMTSIITVAF